jgi:hypothetical protein
MLRFYVRLSLVLLSGLMLLMIAMSALGSTQPIHPALRGFVEGCEGIPQPCWYGIVPGVTRIGDADRALRNAGYSLTTTSQEYTRIKLNFYEQDSSYACGRVRVDYFGAVSRIALICDDVMLGDLIVTFGEPDGVSIASNSGGVSMLFHKGMLSVYESGHLGWMSLRSPIRFMDVNSLTLGQGLDMTSYPWLGFLSGEEYCQREYIHSHCWNFSDDFAG